MDHNPDVYLSMGLTAENVARKYGMNREQADELSLASHRKALAAIAAGKFKDEIAPVEVKMTVAANGAGGHSTKLKTTTTVFEIDEGPRADTSLEALAKLKPAFHVHGTTTAGNSSQMSDGAAATIVMSAERARALGAKPMARFLGFATAGVPPELMGIGPAFAIPKVLKLVGLTLNQIDVIELNEAFAVQSLAVIKELGLDPARINPNGGAIALGHPLGCTGAKLTASILRELDRRNARYGMVTMCIGGGMGAAGIFERVA
jgi:acetyl-CoA acyltransferase